MTFFSRTVYIASPYSSKDRTIRIQRYRAAMQFVAWWLKTDHSPLVPFSPIVYCHEMAETFDLPTDAAFWKQFNEAIMLHSPEIYVLRLPGWEDSKGVMAELAWAKEHQRHIVWVEPRNNRGYEIEPE